MALRRTAVLSSLLSIVLVATVTGAAAGPAAAGTSTTARTTAAVPTTGFQFVDITARDGAVLKANVIAPRPPGRHPAIVFISSWGLNDAEYLAQAKALARRGYVVLSYTARGFWGSGGQIDTAGPRDMADVSDVLDWLIANTPTDPARIGAAGVSYGAGISLIASAFDARIRAVVGMSGWTDMVRSLYGNDTRRPQAVWLLRAAAQLLGRPSAELNAMMDAYFANTDLDPITAWGRVRSAASYVDAINRNRPAIMMANAYGDSLFPPNQLVDFFGRLTGPKRLELAPGDHAVAEAGGLIGLPNHVWDSTARWFDRYLTGAKNGIDTEKPVVLRRLGSGQFEGYTDWAHVTGSTRRYGLGEVRWWDGTGPMTTAPVSGDWSRNIWTGLDTTAWAGIPLLTNGLATLHGRAPSLWLPSVSRLNAGVWVGDPLPSGAAVRGMPKLHLAINSAPRQGTLVAYLYDLDRWGTGRLVTHAPVTWLESTDTLDVKFEATAYDVPAGHRLALVVDSADPLYLGADNRGATFKFTGDSWFDIPMK